MRPPVGLSLADPAPPGGLPDGRLIAAAQAGDRDAFDALLTARLDRTYRTARAILGNEPDARDAVQDAWLSIWRRLPGLRQPAAFDGWVERIVVNACRTRLRARSRVREIPMADGFEQSDPSHGSRPEGVAERDAVERAFERLSPDQRAILVLHHLHHQPVVAIAAALGIPEGTVKWRLHAARTALGQAMEADR
jgi:RNA polymerase sigma-70 factor (ECF subfamily)